MQQVYELMEADSLEGVRYAQRSWAETSLRARLAVVARLRRRMAEQARELAEAVPTHLPGALQRTVADTMVSEVLPLIEACRFLEREAASILRTRRLGREGRPIWLAGVTAEVERAPLGVVLVLAAANYPLFLAGVQTLQALVAGNAVLWKPAPGTKAVAQALKAMLVASGMDAELLTILDSTVEAAQRAMASRVDHVVLTGSAETGKAVMRTLAETLTPATMELSGCDAVFVLPGAELELLEQALAFGLRFNGSFTCMAPRRVFLVGFSDEASAALETRLAAYLRGMPPVELSVRSEALLADLVRDAREQGAAVPLDGSAEGKEEARVTLIVQATPALKAMQTDVFAPILSVMRTADADEALAADAGCSYGLTASIFGPEVEARRLARRLNVGNVLINDVVAPTADPRIPFGGRGSSGFGVTRGAEGLLALTRPRTIQVQRGRAKRGQMKRAYQPTGEGHAELFAGMAQVLHGRWPVRLAGMKRLVEAARKLG